MDCDLFQSSTSSYQLNEFMKYVVLNENVKSKCTAVVADHVTSKYCLIQIAFFVPILLLLPTIYDL